MLQTLDACINKSRIFPLYALGTDTHIGSPGNRRISISSTATPNATINIQRNLALPTRNHIMIYPWALWLHTPPRQQAPYRRTRAHPAPPLSNNRQLFTAAVQVATITPLDKTLHLRSSLGSPFYDDSRPITKLIPLPDTSSPNTGVPTNQQTKGHNGIMASIQTSHIKLTQTLRLLYLP